MADGLGVEHAEVHQQDQQVRRQQQREAEGVKALEVREQPQAVRPDADEGGQQPVRHDVQQPAEQVDREEEEELRAEVALLLTPVGIPTMAAVSGRINWLLFADAG